MRYNLLFFVMVGLLFSLGAPVGRAQDEPPKVLDASEEPRLRGCRINELRDCLQRHQLVAPPGGLSV